MSKSKATEKQPALCYQCGRCSAGCPVAHRMDILPHQLVHMLSLGQEEKVLAANTIWMCAGCFTCAVRCPNSINITSVMDSLREKAVRTGVECPERDVLTFHQVFISDLARRGRVHELRMMGEYNLRSGRPLNNARLAPRMFLKRRLHLLPPKRLKGFRKWIKRIRKR